MTDGPLCPFLSFQENDEWIYANFWGIPWWFESRLTSHKHHWYCYNQADSRAGWTRKGGLGSKKLFVILPMLAFYKIHWSFLIFLVSVSHNEVLTISWQTLPQASSYLHMLYPVDSSPVAAFLLTLHDNFIIMSLSLKLFCILSRQLLLLRFHDIVFLPLYAPAPVILEYSVILSQLTLL